MHDMGAHRASASTKRRTTPRRSGPLGSRPSDDAPGLVRAVLTNFDLSILWFLAASVIDLFRVPMVYGGVAFDLKCALLAFYGVVLPLDFADRLYTYLRTDGFYRDARVLVRRAHHFRAR